MAEFGQQLLAYLIPILGSLLAAVATWAITRLAQKYGVDLNLKRDTAIRSTIRSAILGAEEWAARKAKVERKPEGSEKAAYVSKLIQAKWPKLLPEDLDRLIDEELARTPGTGATGFNMVPKPE